MTMFHRRARLRIGERGSTIRRPKRVNTHDTPEDLVIREFQDILGHLREGDIGGRPILPYDEGFEADRHGSLYSANSNDDILPEADLKNVPKDPSLQALWIAREIKRLAVFNDKHIDQRQARSMSTSSPTSPIFSAFAPDPFQEDQNEIARSLLQSSRSSGRKRRQTNKARDLHLVNFDVDDEQLGVTDFNGYPYDGLAMLSTLVTNERIHHALSHSLNLGPGNFEKRHALGIQFLQSMAADTLPPDPTPAAKLKHSLWRSRNNLPIIAALHILAGFDDVVQAIDVAFQGRLDCSTPLTRRKPPSSGVAHSNDRFQSRSGALFNDDGGIAHLNGDLRSKRSSFSTRTKLVNRMSSDARSPVPFGPELVPRPAPKAATDAKMLPQNEGGPSYATIQRESESEDSVAPEPSGPKHFTVIDASQSAKAIIALNKATAILDDMAYGALKSILMPQQSGPLDNQYLTPYGTPAPHTYVTPYANPPHGQQQHIVAESTALPHALSGPQPSNVSVTGNTNALEMPIALHKGSSNEHEFRQHIFGATKGKGKEKAQDHSTRPDDVLESTETDKDIVAMTKSGPITLDQMSQDDDDDEDFTQIDSFLALAAGDDSDSDDDIDRDRTISREMTPISSAPGDLAIDSIVQGIIGELATNQNWGHGIGFLTPQTHLYQLSNAHHFAEGLRRHINDSRLEVNSVVSAEHGRAQETFYDALIKRITNPYLDGTSPHYSNVVYHNGRAYQAIPGPAHPMYQQQLPYPPPPPPSSQMIPSYPGPLPNTTPNHSGQPSLPMLPLSTRETSRMMHEFEFEPTLQQSASQVNPVPSQSRPIFQEFSPNNPRMQQGLRRFESSAHPPVLIQRTPKRKRASQ